ncbi:MAG: hypothetical protein GFH27_549279n304 [Chloroflexi bacterium AL-W]|nr:hypothetical protein [Chloroflexi bacterium AL-N1]NOK65270.1 hypothetical protein [Chloroflexi bacterium AL-N10]NOK72465.1 hypothetical protein [Chloroflexi bacterium AL-N5]NOK79449.1 hypothetical protein [Chloroflexi bacterium AL-W]NOK87365.1 hypothetical protein [Chloroflexi bacterium AL-N15]
MLDQIDLERTIDKSEYKQLLPKLYAHLYDMEQALIEARIPVLIVFEGWAGASKITTIGHLTRRLDPRGIRVHSITPPRTSERQYPWLYRFWLKIPSYGQIAIFNRSWYRRIQSERVRDDLKDQEWLEQCEDIVAFERQISDDKAIILKFWLHISKKEQSHRFRKLSADPLTSWQLTDEDRWQNKHYERFQSVTEDMIARTDTYHAPWKIIPATNKRYTNLAVIETILHTVELRLGTIASIYATQKRDVFDQSGASFRRILTDATTHQSLQHQDDQISEEEQQVDVVVPPHIMPGILQRVNLSQTIDDKDYRKELRQLQAKLHLLGYQVYTQKRSVVLVFEGWDAAGKGGAIKRLTEKIDPRSYIVHAIAAPAGDDKDRHYLYRFWRRLPPREMIAIFDRSWYGRVLVERVEGFAHPSEWQRAYAEINEFERQLVEFGMIVCKFWLHISPEEQLRRFEERQNTHHKAWKLTDEDWRNREKWPQYEQAADDMLLHCSTPFAPWTLVEAEDKKFARIKVLSTVVQKLESQLGKVNL